MSQLRIKLGQYSDKGVKPGNEDCCGAVIPGEPQLSLKGISVVMADGVSASAAGREASEACVQGYLTDYYSTPDSWSVTTSAQKVIASLNRWLHGKLSAGEVAGRGMLSTFSALVLKSATAHIFHVGDSRIYLLRNQELEQLTRDHQTWESEDKVYLNRAMGADVSLDIDYRKMQLQVGDVFLLTTDGVHNFLSEQEIIQFGRDYITDLDQGARQLVSQALANGSNDNVSCQLVKVECIDGVDDAEFFNNLTRLPFPPELEEGMIMDGYKVLKELHASKRTQVYLALDTISGNKVVVKTPSVNYEDDPQYIDLFLYEEWVGKRIRNKNVVTVMNTDRAKNFLYYVAEYVDGLTLRQWMREHPQPEISQVREIVRQIANGLRGFHRMDMLHQDLKPENIMLDSQGNVKILDFGSTKIAGLAEIKAPIERLSILGTVNYTAPEYLLAEPGSNRSDIFSLGVITYEMLTAKLPYECGLENIKSHKQLAKLHYIPASRYNSMVPQWMDQAIAKAVSANMAQRYELLSEYIQDISKPNLSLSRTDFVPLVRRNPLLFWKVTSLVLLFINVVLLILLFK